MSFCEFTGCITSNKSFLLVCKDGKKRVEGIYTETNLDQAIARAKARGLEVVTVHHFR